MTDQIKVNITQEEIRVNIQEEPEIKVYIDGTRGDATVGDIPGLQEALDQKANVVHEHNISDVVNLQTELNNINNELNNKAEKGDNSDITSLSGITGGISTVDYIDFNILTASLPQEARLNWNETDGTLNLGLKGGNVTLQIGQEQVVRCKNDTGLNMLEGQAVYIQGSTGTNLNIRLAQSNIETTSSRTFGILTENIAHNNSGYVTTAGLVRNINTLHLTEGQAVYLSPDVPGGLTSTKPVAPNHLVAIGWCVRQHASVGAIFVHIINGFELEELHNVLISNLQANDVLVYNSTSGLWENKQVDTSNIQNQLDAINLELDGKANTVHTHNSTDIADFSIAVNGLVDSAITDLKAETDPFPQYLTDAEGDAQYSQLGHTHSISEVTNLQAELDGKASSTHTHTLDNLSDVVSTTPTNGQILKFNGTNWVNSDNVIITSLSGLSDTNILTPTNGQIIVYNSTSGKWENNTPDFASSTHTHTLDSLSDVVSTTPTNGQILKFNGTNWVNSDNVVITSLSGLSDTSITTPTNGQLIRYNSTTQKWENFTPDYASGTHTHTSSNITDFNTAVNGLVNTAIDNHKLEEDPHSQYLTQTEADALYSPLGGSIALDNLIDVTLTTPTAGQVLKYNGSQWINGVDSGSGSGVQGFAVQDNFMATAGQTVFTLSTSATGVSIVAVNGIQQKPTTDYSISGTTLTFTYSLTLNDEVVVTYGTNLASSIGIEDQIIDGVTNLAPSQNAVYDALQLKQNTLVSGTNIKTINGASLLGSGDISISGGGGGTVEDSLFSDVDIIKITTTGTLSTAINAEGTTISAGGVLIKSANTYLSSDNNSGILPNDYGNIGGVLITSSSAGSAYAINTTRPVYTGNTGYKHVIIGGLDYLENPSTNPHYAVMGLVTYTALIQGISAMNSLNLTADGFDTTANAEQLGVIAVIARPGSSNLEIMHREEGGIPNGTYLDLGANFPKVSYQHLRIEIVKLKSSSLIKVSVKNILTGAYEERTISSNIPSSHMALQPIFYTKDSVGNKKCCLSFVKMIGLRSYNG